MKSELLDLEDDLSRLRRQLTLLQMASGDLLKEQRDALMAFFPPLRSRMRPERAPIAPENFAWLFETTYEPKWPETFLPGT